MDIAIFTFNGFQENTYVISDASMECAVVDPGCNTVEERKALSDYIDSKGLKPVLNLNTHCHIDHVLGNKYIQDTYGLLPQYHKGEQIVMDSCEQVAKMYGISYEISPNASRFLEEGKDILFGNTVLKTLFAPGHSPASLCFYNEEAGLLIAGDVLFDGSIGRADLPGGDFDTLIASIVRELLVLPDEVQVFPGHGPATTIGKERKSNPFLLNV